MPIISLKIYNTIHSVTCTEGDEEKLYSLAAEFEKHIIALAKKFPNSKDNTLYLIAALTILDKNGKNHIAPDTQDTPMKLVTEIFETLTEKIDLLTNKVEKL